MTGFVEIIDAVATDTSLPKLFDHPEMSDGSILLFDPNHVYGAFSGVPANGATIPNVASRQMKKIYSLADDISALDMSFEFLSDTDGVLVERTAKNGLHILPSQANQTTNNNKGLIRPSSRLREEIFNRVPTSDATSFYVSAWYKQTRAAISGFVTASRMHLVSNNQPSSNKAWHSQGSPISGTILGSQTASHANGNGSLLGFGSNTWSGTRPGSASSTYMSLYGVGQFDGWANTTNRNKSAGVVIYRLKIEDLSLTKRANGGVGGTPAEEYALAAAADLAAFTAAFNVGGSLYGDTWTDVSTFA